MDTNGHKWTQVHKRTQMDTSGHRFRSTTSNATATLLNNDLSRSPLTPDADPKSQWKQKVVLSQPNMVEKGNLEETSVITE